MNDTALQSLTELLLTLAELEAQRPCSPARLAKQSGRRMSVLLRELSVLEQMGLVRHDSEAGRVGLTEDGRQFKQQIAAASAIALSN